MLYTCFLFAGIAETFDLTIEIAIICICYSIHGSKGDGSKKHS